MRRIVVFVEANLLVTSPNASPTFVTKTSKYVSELKIPSTSNRPIIVLFKIPSQILISIGYW